MSYKAGTPSGNGVLTQDEIARQRAEENEINKALMPNAGEVPLDKPMSCGRGIIAEFKGCVIDWWWAVSNKISFLYRYDCEHCGAP